MKGFLWITLALILPGVALGATFTVRPGGENKVIFISKASMERFEGKTGHLEGSIDVNPADLGDSARVHFEVDLATLDTGIPMRNRHMRENHLETARYPKAIFDGASIHAPVSALVAGKSTPLEVEGTFTLHGVSRRIHIRVEATYKLQKTGEQIAFRTSFPVTLSEYQISRPQFLFMKLAETQEVQVRGVATATAP